MAYIIGSGQIREPSNVRIIRTLFARRVAVDRFLDCMQTRHIRLHINKDTLTQQSTQTAIHSWRAFLLFCCAFTYAYTCDKCVKTLLTLVWMHTFKHSSGWGPNSTGGSLLGVASVAPGKLVLWHLIHGRVACDKAASGG